MASQTELITSDYLTTPSGSQMEVSPPPGTRTFASQVMKGINNFIIVIVFVVLLATVGKWALFGAAKSDTVADWFLRAAGSDKTWEEYQKDHIRKGHPRMEDKDATFLEQLFIDGYAGLND